MDSDFNYQFLKPDAALYHYVESIGMFHNGSDHPKEVVIIPDGRIDLFFTRSLTSPFQIWLMGLETAPKERSIPPQTLTFSVSFKPLAVAYILKTSIAGFLNRARQMDDDFWGFGPDDLNDFDAFYRKA
ncbi:MAG TPA: DUF6597 domain-containing transcriptional factor, partial [Pedobacter sp.]|nr:DUF6597 domain-containing transcriptional factor [Pedobacter sp.]